MRNVLRMAGHRIVAVCQYQHGQSPATPTTNGSDVGSTCLAKLDLVSDYCNPRTPWRYKVWCFGRINCQHWLWMDRWLSVVNGRSGELRFDYRLRRRFYSSSLTPDQALGPGQNLFQFFFQDKAAGAPQLITQLNPMPKGYERVGLYPYSIWCHSFIDSSSRRPLLLHLDNLQDLPSGHNFIARNSIYLFEKNVHRHKPTATKLMEDDILTLCTVTSV
jgi:hypothetical protein